MRRKMSSPSRPASVAQTMRSTCGALRIFLTRANCFLAAAVGTTFRGISSGRMGSVSRRQAFQRGSISSGLHWVMRCPSAQVTT